MLSRKTGSPFDFFVKNRKGKKLKEISQEWSLLPDEEKFHYIDQSLNFYSFTEKYRCDPKRVKWNCPLVDFECYFRCIGLTLPYLTFYEMYASSLGALYNEDEEREVVKEQFSKLGIEQQERLLKDFIELWEDFDVTIAGWKLARGPIYAQAFDTVFKRYLKYQKVDVRSSKFRPVQFEQTEEFGEEIPFEDEPKSLHISPIKLYCHLYKKEMLPLNWDALYMEFADCTPVVRNCFFEVSEDLFCRFRTALLNYVVNLSEEKRKIYLGWKRITYYKIFKRDIFLSKFSSSLYPVFTKTECKFALENDEMAGFQKFLMWYRCEDNYPPWLTYPSNFYHVENKDKDIKGNVLSKMSLINAIRRSMSEFEKKFGYSENERDSRHYENR